MSLYSFAKRQCQVQVHAIARTHQLMQEVHENRSAKLRLTGWKIKKSESESFTPVTTSTCSSFCYTHTSPWHFSVSQQNSGFAFLSRCDGRNPTEGEKSVALCCEIRVYTHTHTAHSRQGVDRSDIWSCLTGQEKIKKKRGEEKKGREERRGKSLPGFHAFCLLHLSGFEEITAECLACLAQHL